MSEERGRLAHLPQDLTILFVALRVCGVIDWSWYLLYLPLLLSYGIANVIRVLR